MSDSFTIRPVQPGDFSAVRTLAELDFRLHREARPDYFRTDWTDYPKEEFDALFAPDALALVAEADGQAVGLCFGVVGETGGTSVSRVRRIAKVEDLATLPAYRGRGIASTLLQRFRQAAKERDVETIELCVWGFNQTAQRLYERLGMQTQYTRMEWPF